MGTLALRVASAALSLGSGVVLGRVLGVDGFGRYAYATSWAALLVIPASLRASMLVVRLTAHYEAERDWATMRGLLGLLGRRVLVASVLVTAAAIASGAVASRLGWAPSALDDAAMGLALLTLPLVSLGQLAQGYLEARQWIVTSQVPDVVMRQGLPVALVGLAAVLGMQVTPGAAACALLIGSALFLVAHVMLARRAAPEELRSAVPRYDLDRVRGRLVPLVVTGGLLAVTQQAGPLVVGALASSEDVAVYVAGARFANILVFVPASLNVAFGAAAARLWAAGDREGLDRVAPRTALLAFAGNLPLAVGLVLGARPLLALLGHGFDAGAPILGVLVLAQLVSNAGGPNGIVLVMTGHERDAAMGMLVAAVVTLGLTAVAAPLAGAMGAAWAAVAGTVAWNLALAFAVRRRLGIGVGVFAGLLQLLRSDNGRS